MLKFAQGAKNASRGAAEVAEEVAVHGNSLKSLKPTWGYKLYSQDGTFFKEWYHFQSSTGEQVYEGVYER